MQGLVTRLACAVLAAAGLVALGRGPAYADTVCQQTDRQTGQCILWVEVPSDPAQPSAPASDGPKDTGSGRSCYWDPSKQGLTGRPAGPVPCTSKDGYWSNAYNCYIRALDPQPAAGDPMWQGHQPGDGAVYTCYQP